MISVALRSAFMTAIVVASSLYVELSAKTRLKLLYLKARDNLSEGILRQLTHGRRTKVTELPAELLLALKRHVQIQSHRTRAYLGLIILPRD